MNRVAKILSANDVGQNGSHQAGILLPKSDAAIMGFFPRLDSAIKNPRMLIEFEDRATRSKIYLNYIYYNGKFFQGENGLFGTRNEYRLTGLTSYFKNVVVREGDLIQFTKLGNKYFIEVVSQRDIPKTRIVLKGNWLRNE